MKKMVIQLICPDQRGIIAKLTSMLYDSTINILSIEQHVDKEKKKFYIRLFIDLSKVKISIDTLKNKIQKLNDELHGQIKFYNPNHKINVAILGTKESEPIYDLLIKNKSNELNCHFPIIVSNHNNLNNIAKQFKIDFLKVSNNNQLAKILKEKKIDLIILARYMQIIPAAIINLYKNKIINIHHGFLPAFKGPNPYRQAYEKGVKIIGATAHYVTDKLDEGPIISQDVITINHKHSVNDLVQLGREIEKNVLYKAVKAHLENRIIVYNNKTIIFS